MNYEPNLVQWPVGSYCIHDYDAKTKHMLMIVVGYTRDGLCKTKYIAARLTDSPRSTPHRRCIWTNPVASLHDPARFGIAVPTREEG